MPETIDDVDEHPIIFNDWSTQRILAGEKTQTRRIVKPQPADGVESVRDAKEEFWQANEMCSEWNPTLWQAKCPYGQPGDVLWVREAFQVYECFDRENDEWLVYDGKPSEAVSHPEFGHTYGLQVKYRACGNGYGPWRPSIHMPRELCRIRLRVEDVRVERVQEISQDDAVAEGIPGDYIHGEKSREYTDARHVVGPKYGGSAITEFSRKWNDIHGDGAWERNDWVWVVEFSQINE